MDSAETVGQVWDEALSSDRPVIIDAHTNPEIACLPPHITMEQAGHYWKAVLHGDPNSREMIRQSLRQMIEAWKPHSNGH